MFSLSRLSRFMEFAIASSIEIDAPAKEVWSAMTNIDNFPNVFWNVTSVERIDGAKEGSAAKVGSRYRIHRQTRQGERYHADWTITALEEGRSITFYSHNIVGEGMTSSSTWSVAPARHSALLDATDETSARTFHESESSAESFDTALHIRNEVGTACSAEGDVRAPTKSFGIEEGNSREEKVAEAKKGVETPKSVATITLAIVPNRLFLMAGRIMCCCIFKKRAQTCTDEDLEDLRAAAQG